MIFCCFFADTALETKEQGNPHLYEPPHEFNRQDSLFIFHTTTTAAAFSQIFRFYNSIIIIIICVICNMRSSCQDNFGKYALFVSPSCVNQQGWFGLLCGPGRGSGHTGVCLCWNYCCGCCVLQKAHYYWCLQNHSLNELTMNDDCSLVIHTYI